MDGHTVRYTFSLHTPKNMSSKPFSATNTTGSPNDANLQASQEKISNLLELRIGSQNKAHDSLGSTIDRDFRKGTSTTGTTIDHKTLSQIANINFRATENVCSEEYY